MPFSKSFSSHHVLTCATISFSECQSTWDIVPIASRAMVDTKKLAVKKLTVKPKSNAIVKGKNVQIDYFSNFHDSWDFDDEFDEESEYYSKEQDDEFIGTDLVLWRKNTRTRDEMHFEGPISKKRKKCHKKNRKRSFR